MLAKSWSSSIQGVEAFTVEVEVNATGIGNDNVISVVGLPDTAVRESRERVWSAMQSAGFFPPYGRTTVSLAPADIRKEGAAFDLPIALGMVAATNGFERTRLGGTLCIGELALDGGVRAVHGVLPIALHASQQGFTSLLVPKENAREAAVAQGIQVYGVTSLAEAVDFFRGDKPLPQTTVDVQALYGADRGLALDFAEVKGQESAKRALEIAAAGAHNVLMIGSPGTGKTMLAQRLPSILPPLSLAEALEVTRIHSIAGVLERDRALVTRRPFRSPHHTVSDAGLIGGMSVPRPGEISLAHNGVLFLDELPEFKRNVLEVLRQPLESGQVTISRAVGTYVFPARFMMVAAMNPCPCGYFGHVNRPCRCSAGRIQQYRAKVSGPLLDRIDIHLDVPPIRDADLLGRTRGMDSTEVRGRVEQARGVQRERFGLDGIRTNAEMTPGQIERYCPLREDARAILRLLLQELHLSARSFHRVLRVARTIADLAGEEHIAQEHLNEAIQYRFLDRQAW